MYDIGIDHDNVRLGWKIESNRRNTFQKEYHLLVRDVQNLSIRFLVGTIFLNLGFSIRALGMLK